MNILFICKYNRFRSKIAESFFNKLNKNKKHKAKSAGLIRGSPISKEIINAADDFEIKINSKPEGISTKLLKWQNLTIIVANDVTKSILKDNKKYSKKLIVWKISDTDSTKKEDIKKIISKIELKVKKIVDSLN
jgi:protein-tyrosine-phosphatase